MAVSGTISSTLFDTGRIIDHAARRAGIPAQAITSELHEIAKFNLYLFLSELSNSGIQLWAIDKQVLTLTQGLAGHVLPTSTIDIQNVNLRRTSLITTGTSAPSLGGTQVSFSPITVTIVTVGVTFTTGGTYNIIVETSPDGIIWTAGANVVNTTYATGALVWFDLDPTANVGFIRVRDGAAQTLNVSLSLSSTPQETTIYRMSQDHYFAFPNKASQGPPLQMWLNRQRDAPIMTFWPTPDLTSATSSQVTYMRQRYIMDIGTLTQTLDIPQRWYQYVIWNLALYLLAESPDADQKQLPIIQVGLAMSKPVMRAERDNSTFRITPNIRAYTR